MQLDNYIIAVRDHFNVQTGASAGLLQCHKYIKRFGTLVLSYEFGWSLAGLQARRQCREKMESPFFLLRVKWEVGRWVGNKFH